jgi:hypothetical protein
MEVVHEDDEVIVEWSRATPAVETVAVTFDPISVSPTEPAYAAHFLHRLGIDTLCVRKKREHFYQPLSRERFTELAGPVLARYRRRLAYGSSLGAYAVMYFCVHGFDTVIASSPRVSAHPRLGRPYWQERVPFEHEAFDPARPASSQAVVFYDPHDEADRLIVEQELRPAWPRGRFIAVPFSGHPANQFLSEIGYISPFVQAVVADRAPPVLNRRVRKAESPAYHFVLGAACLRHRKLGWTEQLCRRALALRPDFVSVQLTLGQSLLAQGRLDEAEAAIRLFVERYPRDGDGQQALANLERERARRLRPQAVVLPPPELLADRWQLLRSSLRRRGSKLHRAAAAWRSALHVRAAALQARLRPRVRRDDVVWCFRHLLGREPESELVLAEHARCTSLQQLVSAVMSSAEYRRRLPAGSAAEPDADLAQLVLALRGLVQTSTRVLETGPRTCLRTAGHTDPASELHLEQPVFDVCVDTDGRARSSAELERLLDNARRALRPGGLLLCWFDGPAGADSPVAPTLRRHGFALVGLDSASQHPGRLLVRARLSSPSALR